MNIPKIKFHILKLLSLFSTSQTVKFTHRLFTTPIKSEISEQESFFLKSIHTDIIYIKAIDKEINFFTYGYSQKAVLLLHSWSGRSTEFHSIANKLLEHGYMVVAFDLPINQQFNKKHTNFNEFIEIIYSLNNKFNFTAAIGHGIGGLALYNSTKQLQLKKLVTIGCPNTITEEIRKFNHRLGLKKEISALIINKIENDFNVNLTDIEAGKNALTIDIPTLIIHNKNDKNISIQNAHDIKINLKKAQSTYTEGLNQRAILNDENTTNQIINFINNANI